MSTQTILAEKTVSATELRKHPSDYFLSEPVAVLSNNKTVGYMVGPELFEKMVRLIEAKTPSVEASFRPSAARLKMIATQGAGLLTQATPADLGDFTE